MIEPQWVRDINPTISTHTNTDTTIAKRWLSSKAIFPHVTQILSNSTWGTGDAYMVAGCAEKNPDATLAFIGNFAFCLLSISGNRWDPNSFGPETVLFFRGMRMKRLYRLRSSFISCWQCSVGLEENHTKLCHRQLHFSAWMICQAFWDIWWVRYIYDDKGLWEKCE